MLRSVFKLSLNFAAQTFSVIIIGYLSALFIGISLGLIGSGGSILTVPILVYVFKIDLQMATSYSLFIVGVTAFIGAYQHYKLGNLQIKPSLLLGIPSILTLLFTRKIIVPLIPHHLITIGYFEVTKNNFIMMVFAILMIAASASMIKKSIHDSCTSQKKSTHLILIGFATGFITGFLGAGGGFLIIPSLIFFAGLPVKKALGTSLFIIAFNALIGFSGDLLNGIALNFQLLAIITTIAIAGIFMGVNLSKKIEGDKLKPLFGWFVMVMGIIIIVKELLH